MDSPLGGGKYPIPPCELNSSFTDIQVFNCPTRRLFCNEICQEDLVLQVPSLEKTRDLILGDSAESYQEDLLFSFRVLF